MDYRIYKHLWGTKLLHVFDRKHGQEEKGEQNFYHVAVHSSVSHIIYRLLQHNLTLA